MESYSANCYIHNDNGKYRMECKMTIGDQNLYANYTGDNFQDGVDGMITSLIEQSLNSQPPVEEKLEDKVTRLENQILQLQKENAALKKNQKPACERHVHKEEKSVENAWDQFLTRLLFN